MLATPQELTQEQKSRIRMLVETFYDCQSVRIQTDNRIQGYAEEKALAHCIGWEEVDRLRKLGDKNVEFKKQIRIRKKLPKDKKTGALKLSEAHEDYQKFHDAFENARKDLEGDEKHRRVNDLMAAQERLLVTQAKAEIAGHPLWTEWLSKVKGIGPCLAGGIISWIDIRRCPHASNLISYAGLSVVTEKMVCLKCDVIVKVDKDTKVTSKCPKCGSPYRIIGHGVRRERGKLLGYNPRVKTLCWKIGASFVKTKGGYRELYNKLRAQIEAKIAANDGYCSKEHKNTKGEVIKCFDAHIFAMAKRATVKIFLSHVYLKWRKIMGLPTSQPFAFGILGHDPSSYIEPITDED